MSNNLDRQYLDLLADVLANGTKKNDRTGVGTYSVFGRQMRFKMSEGFPLLTTKKIYTKAMFHELLWFLKGGDNIKYLVDNDVRIWNEWPYKAYIKHERAEFDTFLKNNPDVLVDYQETTMDQFVQSIKEDKHYFTGELGFAKKWGDLGPVYGKQWVDWKVYDEIGHHYSSKTNKIEEEDVLRRKSINQIDQIIDDLKNNPDSRRIMVSAWNPADLPKQLLPPCHYAFQLWTKELTAEEREEWYNKNGAHGTGVIKLVAHILNSSEDVQHDKIVNKHIHDFLDNEGVPSRGISLMFHMRSVDCLLGMPFDIASYGALLHMIAHCTDMLPIELVITTGDTHIYLNHVEQVKLQMTRSPFKLPTLKINTTNKNIYEIGYEDFVINDYKCHPSIKADVAV